ncbi:MAG: hypothetical protein GZ088_10020 [Acidipila sp.]|nr:hypothetical protein [Acidipila sp.]
MSGDIVCAQCDRTEQLCTCDRFCMLCKGQDHVQLAEDGQYYCPDCREACDVRLANPGRSSH